MKTLLWYIAGAVTANLVFIIVNNLKQNKMADQFDDFGAVLSDIDKSTDECAQELEMLRGVVANAGLNKTQETQILDRLTATANKLRGIAKPEATGEAGSGLTDSSTGTGGTGTTGPDAVDGGTVNANPNG